MSESGVLLEAGFQEEKPTIKKSDHFFYYLFWPVFKLPKVVTPNHISYLRLGFCVPLGYLIFIGYLKTAGAFFIFMALMDGLDGSMARIRDQITTRGKLVDPIADKGQTITVLIYMNSVVMALSYTWLSRIMIGIDLTLLGVALLQWLVHDFLHQRKSLNRPGKWLLSKLVVRETGANNWGKGKMVTLVVTLSAMLLFNPRADFFVFQSWKLPWHLTIYSFIQPLLVSCVILGAMSLKGHLQTIKLLK